MLYTDLPGLVPHGRGKVRDLYEVDDALLIVATDRISAFDHVLGSGIPDKGRVLTQLSRFWFARTASLVPNHVLTADADEFPPMLSPHAEVLRGRAMLVRRTEPIPIECVARGYLSGAGWKAYQASGSVAGVALPPGLAESAELPAPIFTPATKATSGHDLTISEAEAARLVGADLVARLRELTLALYAHGAAHAARCGIILADTKFEFGLDAEGALLLIDELMTPDSSRYWPADRYRPGGPQASFDKQFVRDYLESIGWSKQPPVPSLPDDVVVRTRDKYLDAFRRLTGRDLD
ncbi:MAG: phosphoribosylaminoimidazolesuccinocarboxamide synthase [Acidimicrobiia bacterium]|nr:phosphoribosylaminoimidazolesuccinocarboxamide synthase [Acidimicrobiia bacterium]